jgi:glycosyltransferase involved in cell wall biosynthesis
VNILHVTREIGSNARYGIRKSLTPVLEALRNRGHSVTLFDQDDAVGMPPGKPVKFAETFYFSMLRRRFGSGGELALAIIMERVRVARAAAWYAARHKITHVHCHDPLLARVYAFFAPLYGATDCWGYSAHAYGRFAQLRLGVETSESSLAYLQNWENLAARKAGWVVAPSLSGLDQMSRDLALSMPPSSWYVVPHAVTKPLVCSRDAARLALGMDENEKLLVAIGQLIPLKRFSLLLESIALFPAELRPRVLVLGEGEEHAALLVLAEKLGLKDRFEIRVTDNIGEDLAAAP